MDIQTVKQTELMKKQIELTLVLIEEQRKTNKLLTRLGLVIRENGGVTAVTPAAGNKTHDGLTICSRHGMALREHSAHNNTWYSHKVLDEKGNQVKRTVNGKDVHLWCEGYRTDKKTCGYDVR